MRTSLDVEAGLVFGLRVLVKGDIEVYLFTASGCACGAVSRWC